MRVQNRLPSKLYAAKEEYRSLVGFSGMLQHCCDIVDSIVGEQPRFKFGLSCDPVTRARQCYLEQGFRQMAVLNVGSREICGLLEVALILVFPACINKTAGDDGGDADNAVCFIYIVTANNGFVTESAAVHSWPFKSALSVGLDPRCRACGECDTAKYALLSLTRYWQLPVNLVVWEAGGFM